MKKNIFATFMIWTPLTLSIVVWLGLALQNYANSEQLLKEAKFRAAEGILNGSDYISAGLLKNTTPEEYGENLFKTTLTTLAFVPVFGAGITFFFLFFSVLAGGKAPPETGISVELSKLVELHKNGTLTAQELEAAKQKLLSKTG